MMFSVGNVAMYHRLSCTDWSRKKCAQFNVP